MGKRKHPGKIQQHRLAKVLPITSANSCLESTQRLCLEVFAQSSLLSHTPSTTERAARTTPKHQMENELENHVQG